MIVKIFLSTLNFLALHAITDDQKRTLEERYEISGPRDCRISLNREVAISKPGEDLQYAVNHQLACTLLGYKKMYWTEDDLVTEEKSFDPDIRSIIKEDPEFSVMNLYFQKEGLLKPTSLVYKKDAEIDALRLALYTVYDAWGYTKFYPYITGLLLGYPESDRDFFYLISGFHDTVMTDQEKEIYHLADFVTWPDQFKSKLFAYEKDVWPSSAEFKDFVNDKDNAESWLKSVEHLSPAQLRQQITGNETFRCWNFKK
jgi:hypothetical protein